MQCRHWWRIRLPLIYFALLVPVLGQEVAETDDFSEPADAVATATENLEAAPIFARLVKVPLPIQGTIDTQVVRSVEQVLSNLPASDDRPTIVLEFSPPREGTGESSEFGRALDLARFLVSQKTSQARLVAYIPKTVKGHAVLPILACEEIIMHPDAQIGAAGIDEDTIDDTLRRGYSEIADRRRTIPAAVAVGLLDENVQVLRLTTTSGVRYALGKELSAIQAETTVQKIDTMIPAGEAGLLAGDKLRLEYGFVSSLAQDRKELAAYLKVSPNDLDVDPLFGGEWVAIQVDLHGPINTVTVDRAIRNLKDSMAANSAVNFVCVSIDSPGGSVQESLRLANYLSALDSAKIRTVAYVASEARSDAALIAMGCDQMVLHEDAILGGDGARNLSDDDVASATTTIQEMMREKNQTWSLPVAMVDPYLEVHRYQMRESTLSDYFCEEELAQQRDPDNWERMEEIASGDGVLKLEGKRAGELRLAEHVVSDFNEFKQRLQLEDSPEVLRANWAQDFIAALANPQVAGWLLFIGFFAVIFEGSAPGLGVGGFIAAICFLLFFWSNFLQGTAGWLEVLLFIAGIFFIAMEVFVLPGFGIFGLGGGFMVLVSLVLASQTFVIPQNDYQLEQLPKSLLLVAAAVGGVGASIFVFQKYLAESPVFKRLALAPVSAEVAAERERRESIVHYDHLVGKQGKTTTPLSPSGKADIDGDLYDVVSDGFAVDKAALIEVIEVRGNQVIVRQMS